jgi:hypothetical protein
MFSGIDALARYGLRCWFVLVAGMAAMVSLKTFVPTSNCVLRKLKSWSCIQSPKR